MGFSWNDIGSWGQAIIGAVTGNPIPLMVKTTNAFGDKFGIKSDTDKTNEANAKINQTNLDFQKEQFQYQKYLNNNQIQIQSADAQKAGINPLAMNGGSLSAGNYSNASIPMENGASEFAGLANLVAQFAGMKNQKAMNKATNQSNKDIAFANASNALEIAKMQQDTQILKILSDRDIADNLNKNQMDMLIRRLGSEEKVAGWTLSEQNRHNVVMERIENSLTKSRVDLNSAEVDYKKKMSYISEVNSAIDNYVKVAKNEQEVEKLQNAKAQLQADIKDKKWNHAKIIIDSVLRTFGIVVSAIR